MLKPPAAGSYFKVARNFGRGVEPPLRSIFFASSEACYVGRPS